MTKREKPAAMDFIKGSRAIAEEIGVSPQTVLNLVHRGQIPAFVLGNSLTIRRDRLHAWIRAQELRAEADALERKAAEIEANAI